MLFKVPDMTCGGCASKVINAVNAVAGVETVDVDIPAREVRVVGHADEQVIREAIVAAGFGAETPQHAVTGCMCG